MNAAFEFIGHLGTVNAVVSKGLTSHYRYLGTIALIDDLKLRTLIGSISPPDHPTVSLWDYLKEELTAADFESTQELKRERVANFLSVPIAFEKVCVRDYESHGYQ